MKLLVMETHMTDCILSRQLTKDEVYNCIYIIASIYNDYIMMSIHIYY